jgi:hypothetical protein
MKKDEKMAAKNCVTVVHKKKSCPPEVIMWNSSCRREVHNRKDRTGVWASFVVNDSNMERF